MNDRNQNQATTSLRLQMSKLFWQITTPGIHMGVYHSWLAENSTLPPSGSFLSNTDIKNLKSTTIAGIYCHIIILELSFPGPNTTQVLEAHIMTYIISPYKSELVS